MLHFLKRSEQDILKDLWWPLFLVSLSTCVLSSAVSQFGDQRGLLTFSQQFNLMTMFFSQTRIDR